MKKVVLTIALLSFAQMALAQNYPYPAEIPVDFRNISDKYICEVRHNSSAAIYSETYFNNHFQQLRQLGMQEGWVLTVIRYAGRDRAIAFMRLKPNGDTRFRRYTLTKDGSWFTFPESINEKAEDGWARFHEVLFPCK